MKDRQTRVLEALRGSQGFLDENNTLLAVINQSGARRTLDDVVTQLSTHAVNQNTGTALSRGETANQKSLRHTLRFNHMKPIADVARMHLREVPNFIALTRPRNNVSAMRLIAAAAGMADAAAPYAEVFVNAGLPSDFLEQLEQAARDMRRSLDDRAQHARTRTGATEGLKAAEKRGAGILRLLDGLVIPKLGTNDPLLAQWKSARKIHAKTGPVAGGSQSHATSTQEQTEHEEEHDRIIVAPPTFRPSQRLLVVEQAPVPFGTKGRRLVGNLFRRRL